MRCVGPRKVAGRLSCPGRFLSGAVFVWGWRGVSLAAKLTADEYAGALLNGDDIQDIELGAVFGIYGVVFS